MDVTQLPWDEFKAMAAGVYAELLLLQKRAERFEASGITLRLIKSSEVHVLILEDDNGYAVGKAFASRERMHQEMMSLREMLSKGPIGGSWGYGGVGVRNRPSGPIRPAADAAPLPTEGLED